MLSLQQMCEQTCQVAKVAGSFMLNERQKFSADKIESKGPNDFVSYVDKGAEEIIVKGLKELFPEAGFLTEEETTKQEQKEYTWIIDPLDGTTNYIHGMPPYSVSIALTKNNIPIMGVIFIPPYNECFYAWEGSPAYLNGNIIKPSENKTIENSLLITGFPSKLGKKVKNYLEIVNHLVFNSHGIRRVGSAAADLVYIACGRGEVFFQTDLAPWDVAAGAFIAKQAGAIVSDFKQGENYIFGKSIVATNPSVYKEAMELLQQYFPDQE